MISIIVPAYNIESYLGGCLDSILAQTYKDIEVIVVDDGSKDGTGRVADEYAEKDSRVKVIHKDNAGVTEARLDGIDAAGGDYIGFVDGDDVIEPDMYERLLGNLEREDADISHCGHVVERPNAENEYYYNTGKYEVMTAEKGVVDLLDGVFEPGLCNKLFKADLFDKMFVGGLLDTSIKNYEDLLMNYILFSCAKKSVYEDFCPYHYQKRDDSASTSGLNMNIIWDPIRVKDIILSDCEKNEDISNEDISCEVLTAAKKAFLKTCINQYNVILSQKNNAFDGEKEQIRQLIFERQFDFDYLSKKYRILAKLILKHPKTYKAIYKTCNH